MIGRLLQAAGGDLGFVGEFLTEFGIPPTLASAIGSAAVFFVVSVGLILGGKLVVVPVIDRLLTSRGIDPHARKPIRFVVLGTVVLLAVGLGFALAGYGNVLLALSTVAAAATLAVGLAMQDVIKNFVAGAFIYTDRPFRTGDWIEWEANSGYVEDISLRVTRVRTFDNEHLTVPNSQLTDDVIKNYDRNGTLRLRFVFRIGFRDDVDEAMELILDAARAQEGILDDPAPSVKFTEINEASFGLQSRIWIRDPGESDFLGIRGEFVKGVTDRFERAGIEIPYPHRTVEGTLDVPGPGEVGVTFDD
jgi:small-conductance mechanosensitive channel